jgi:hypothetical protein
LLEENGRRGLFGAAIPPAGAICSEPRSAGAKHPSAPRSGGAAIRRRAPSEPRFVGGWSAYLPDLRDVLTKIGRSGAATRAGCFLETQCLY